MLLFFKSVTVCYVLWVLFRLILAILVCLFLFIFFFVQRVFCRFEFVFALPGKDCLRRTLVLPGVYDRKEKIEKVKKNSTEYVIICMLSPTFQITMGDSKGEKVTSFAAPYIKNIVFWTKILWGKNF